MTCSVSILFRITAVSAVSALLNREASGKVRQNVAWSEDTGGTPFLSGILAKLPSRSNLVPGVWVASVLLR